MLGAKPSHNLANVWTESITVLWGHLMHVHTVQMEAYLGLDALEEMESPK